MRLTNRFSPAVARLATLLTGVLPCVLVCAFAGGGCSGEASTPDGPDPWDGAYTKPGLQLVLAKSSREYLGELTLDGAPLIATATLVDGAIEGTFVSEGETFAFSMKQEGDGYVLTSGGVEHLLTRTPPEAPATSNPLAKLPTSSPAAEVPALPAEPLVRPSSVEAGMIELLAEENLELVVNYGVMLLGEKKFDEATYAFDYVLRRNPESTFAWYNLACVRSLEGKTEEALAALSKSIEFGYDQFEHMQQDPDLDAIRSLPEYKALVAGRGSSTTAEPAEEAALAPKDPPKDQPSGPIVAELVGGFRKTTIRGSGSMSFVTDRYLWLYANGQCEDGSKSAGGDANSSFRNGDGSPGSTGTWSATADTLSMRWNDGSTEDYTWSWYDNGVSAVQLLLSAGGSHYRYSQFE